jgi:antitoxin component of MazEF toxin-antitoxin module
MKLRLELLGHGGNTAGFEIPDEVVEELGGGRKPKVVVTVGAHTWRSSIVNMGGTFMLGVSMENRAAAGVAAGETLDVEITLDTAPRTVDLPDDLAAELERDPAARAAWETWSFTRQKEAARSLTEARKPETRSRRLDKVLAELRG